MDIFFAFFLFSWRKKKYVHQLILGRKGGVSRLGEEKRLENGCVRFRENMLTREK